MNIKNKDYPPGCFPGSSIRRPIVMLTHDESTFQANDGRKYAWMREDENDIRPKGKGRGIMVSDFLLPCSRLSTTKLSPKKRSKLNLPLYSSSISNMDPQEKGIGRLMISTIPPTLPYRWLRLFSPDTRHFYYLTMLGAMHHTRMMPSWYRT
jgi:hypothetical protein